MNTQQLVRETRARFKHQESKLYLEEKYSSQLTFSSQGGSWTASPELISFLAQSDSTIILLDNFKNPIKVDTTTLLEQMKSVYDNIMQEWYDEFEQLRGYR